MGELRQSLASKRWVIIATERAKRPADIVPRASDAGAHLPEYDPTCPFCPGNEEADLEVARFPESGPWQVRIVRNRYPALDYKLPVERTFDGVHRKINAVGYHEVLVESPRHNTSLALESPESVALMLIAFQRRGKEIAADPRIEHVLYFKNHGSFAGSSLPHPHGQLMGLPVVPAEIRERAEQARHYYDDTGTCVFCTMLRAELNEQVRIVIESEHYAAFIPFAAFSPFHLWIMPKRHNSSFLEATEEELADLARVLRRVLRKLYYGLHDPAYNFIIRSAPLHDPSREYMHWYLTIVPRVSQAAGFELASDMFINSTLPEESAAFLRDGEEEPRAA